MSWGEEQTTKPRKTRKKKLDEPKKTVQLFAKGGFRVLLNIPRDNLDASPDDWIVEMVVSGYYVRMTLREYRESMLPDVEKNSQGFITEWRDYLNSRR